MPGNLASSAPVWLVPGVRTPFAPVDGFLLAEGEETIEPRLDPIDLRRDLRQLELELRSADGSPIAPPSDPFGRALARRRPSARP